MGKSSTPVSIAQGQENPTVLIRYEPANAPLALANDAMKVLARVQSVKPITNIKTLESLSTVLGDAQLTYDEMEDFLTALRSNIERACEKVREFDGYRDFSATLTVRRWDLKRRLMDGIGALRGLRAQFLADEQERVNRENLAKQAEQDRINREAADKAMKAALKAGADKATAKEIAQAVKETPAPVIESKAANMAQASGVTVQFKYYPRITDLMQFLAYCARSEPMMASLRAATPEIEKVFQSLCTMQKEHFSYPGMTFVKKPVDYSRGR